MRVVVSTWLGLAVVAAPFSAAAAMAEQDVLSALLQAESLLCANDHAGAAALAAKLPQSGPHAPATLRVTAWALWALADHATLARALASQDHLSPELHYLRGAARLRSGDSYGGREELRSLWWQQPYGLWGLAAVGELARLGLYSARETELIAAHAPRVTHDLAEQAAFDGVAALQRLAKHAPRGQLRAEVWRGLGMRRLEQEKFGEALTLLRQARAAARDHELQRAITLSLGEAEHRRGNVRQAAAHFDEVAATGDDALAHEALALAGQMFIERKHYKEARRRFQAQLLANPVGPARQAALWGMGWVAYRTGSFTEARQFFATLTQEAPFGPRAPSAAYWGARAMEELGQSQTGRQELVRLATVFPTDYYAFRASAHLGAQPWPAPAPVPSLVHPAIQRLNAAAETSVEASAAALSGLTAATLSELGPNDLLRFVRHSEAQGLSAELGRNLLLRRFPQVLNDTSGVFPSAFAPLVVRETQRARLPAELVLAVIRQESGFNARAVSPVGALGLMQLMPGTAEGLLLEADRHAAVTADLVLDPATNIRLGTRYLGRMLRTFAGRIEYALASYNAGPGAVTRWRQGQGDLPVDIFVEEIPYAETRDYVRRVLGHVQTQRYLASRQQAVAMTAR